MWRTIIVALALICLGLLGYYAVTKRAVQISAGLAVSATSTVQSKLPGVTVVVDQRDARLVGAVSSDALRSDAERIVAGVSGIRSVKNELVVEVPAPAPAPAPEKGPEAPPTIDPVPTTPAATVAPEAAPDVVDAPAASPPSFDLTWDGQTLTARGALPDGLRQDLGLTFAGDFPDAVVKDETVVTTNPGTPELARAMKTAVTAIGRLTSGHVKVDEEDFELTGVAATAEAEAAVKKLVGDEVKTLASTVTLTIAPAADVDAADGAGEVPEVAAAVPPAPAEGELTPAQCQSAIDALVEGTNRITFKGPTGRIDEAGDVKIQEVWRLLQRCPTARGTIVGFHDHLGEPDKVKQLSAIRAFNVHKRLVELGMDKDRFKFSGVGQRDFRYPNKGETRVLNQRIEFRIEVQ